jgi:hypothetical protein
MLNGTSDQSIDIAGTGQEIFHNLIVQKSSGNLILNDSIRSRKYIDYEWWSYFNVK